MLVKRGTLLRVLAGEVHWANEERGGGVVQGVGVQLAARGWVERGLRCVWVGAYCARWRFEALRSPQIGGGQGRMRPHSGEISPILRSRSGRIADSGGAELAGRADARVMQRSVGRGGLGAARAPTAVPSLAAFAASSPLIGEGIGAARADLPGLGKWAGLVYGAGCPAAR